MRVFVGNQTPTGEMIQRECVSLIKKIIASKPPNNELGVVIHENFGVDNNAHFHTDHPNWNSTFQHVWERMFPSERNGVQVHDSFHVLMNSSVRNQVPGVISYAANVAPNATMPGRLDDTQLGFVHRQVVPASAPKNKEPMPDSSAKVFDLLPSEPISVYSDDDDVETTELTAAIVLQEARYATQNTQDLTIRARFVTDNHPGSSESKILLDQSIAALKNAKNETDSAVLLDAVSTAGGSIPSHFLVADSDHISHVSILCQIPAESDTKSSASSATPLSEDAILNDAEVAAFFAATSAPILPLHVQHLTAPWFCANGAGGPLSVISERTQDGADQSGDSSPHSSDGGRRAPSTTSALSPSQGVEHGALGAHPLSSADLSRSADAFSSGPSGKPSTHELSSMLLAASMPSSPQSAFTPAAVTSADGSTLAQSSGKLLASAPPLPLKTDFVRRKMNDGGTQSSGNPIGNPPGIVQSNVGVGRNLPANLTSLSSQGDGGGPPVQVLARSVDPPGNSSGADYPKTPSSSKLWSDSSKVRTNPPASLLKSKSSSPKERNGIGGSNPVAHSSDNSSVSASTIQPLSQTVVFPAGRTGIGGSQGAQFQADRLVNAPPPAPSLSPELGSAATPAAPPNEKPSTLWGVDIGGGEHNRVGTQFVELAFRILMMKYSKSLPDPLPTWTPPCVPNVPFLVARQARVAYAAP